MELLIVGKPNVGKTLLMINFAAYLGLRELHLEVSEGDGVRRSQRLTTDRARRDLVSLYAPKTHRMQTLMLDQGLGRQRVPWTVADTMGIAEGIAEEPEIRHQVALTLERLLRADMVLHVLDASSVGLRRMEAPGPFDAALAELGQLLKGYLIIANKMDKPGSHEGLRLIKERYRGVPVTPVSAVTRRGFRDMKNWMARLMG